MSSRHKWSEPDHPTPHRTLRTCKRCGLIKISRREPGSFWTEFWNGTDRLMTDKTPSCEPATEEVTA